MFLWVGLSINAEWIQQVFGVNSVAQVDIDKVGSRKILLKYLATSIVIYLLNLLFQTKLRDFDNPLSVRVREIINTIRNERHRHMKVRDS